MGLLKALELYPSQTQSEADQHRFLKKLQTVERLAGITSTIIKDDSRDIYRLRITVDPLLSGMNALAIVEQLKQGETAIYTRDYHANQGFFDIDPRALHADDINAIYSKLKSIIRRGTL